MKRTRLEDSFNPVYPYEADSSTPSVPFVAPPFVSSEGLEESPPGVLSLKYTAPITTDAKGQLTLKLGNNISVVDGALSAAVPSVFPPLTNTNNTLTLATAAPLTTNSNSLALAITSPLTLTNNSLTVALANPLQVQNGNIQLRLTNLSGLTIRNDGLALNAGWGTSIAGNNELTINFANPLSIYENGSNVGKLYVKIGQGLQLQSDGSITAKLGSGLTFNSNGAIQVSSSTTRNTDYAPATLWTIPGTTANCSVYQNLDAQLILCLSKRDSMVFGTVGLVGISQQFKTLNRNSVSVQLVFDSHGQLISSPLANGVWGKRENNSVVSVTDGLAFMPNSTFYTRGTTSSPKNFIYVNTYLRGNLTKPIILSVGLNTASNNYSIKFEWTHRAGEWFIAPPCNFSFITEQ